MGDAIANGLLIPALGLALFGWLVPRGLSLIFPEGVRPLLVLGFVSTLVMVVLSAAMFVGLYLVQGLTLSELFVDGFAAGMSYFGQLGLLSALLWGPILIVSVAGLPRTWVDETW